MAGQSLDHLLQQYKPLVRARARAYFLHGGDMDDLLQEGMIGLMRAARDYDETRGNFAAFAALCVERQIQSAIKAAGRKKHMLLSTAGELDTEIQGTATDPEALLLDREAARDIDGLIRHSLTKMERDVLHLHLAGEAHAHISAALGIPKKSVDNAIQRIRRKLRALIG
jgi:RNA polymerase sporulation-specific sigma factor